MKPLNKKSSYVIGVSGGPDSMALLDMAFKMKLKIKVAHINYHTRRSSNRDMRIVIDYCHKNNIPCEVLEVKKKGKGNFEAWAREIRYDFYQSLLEDNGILLLGHHQDDHLETYLMQKEKNSEYAWMGLKEDSYVGKIHVIRPLLNYRKEELIAYCDQNNITYGIDETNLTNKYHRNYIRHEKVEKLSEKKRLQLLKKIDQENQNKIIEEKELKNLFDIFNDFDLKKYQKINKEKRYKLIRYYLVQYDDNAWHYSKDFINEIDKMLLRDKNYRIELNNGMIWDKDYGKLYLHTINIDYEYQLDKKRIFKTEDIEIKKDGNSFEGAYITKDDYPLTIRNYREGDYILMKYGKKKLSRWFIDQKIPKYLREKWPVVINKNGDIILVSGIGCDKNHYRLPYNFFISNPKKTKR